MSVNRHSLAIVLSPGDNHVRHLKKLYRSIVANCKAPPDVWLFASCCDAARAAPSGVHARVIREDDVRTMMSLYFQEGRADIQPFAAYAQLWVPSYFTDYEKVLFLEVDQLVVNSLDSLLREIREQDIKLGAVRSCSPTLTNPYNAPDSFRRLHPEAHYYNTGVMVIDCEHWVRAGYQERCVQELRAQKMLGGKRLDYYAQGAINNALAPEITVLDGRYNHGGLGWLADLNQKDFASAVILHWVGPRKPWQANGLYQEWYYFTKSSCTWRDALAYGALRITSVFMKLRRVITGA